MRVAQYLVRIRIRLSASLPVGRRSIRPLLAAVVLVIHLSSGIEAQETPVPDSARPPVLAVGGDSVSISLVDVELRVAVQALGRHLDRPLLQNVDGGGRVTLETPRPVPRAQVASLLRALVQGRGYEFVDDSAAGSYLVRPLDGGRGSAQAAVRPDAAPASLQGLAGLGVFAYQLLHVLRTTALTGEWQRAQPARLRAWLFRLPAKLTVHARKRYVQLRRDERLRKPLLAALRVLGGLSPPRRDERVLLHC